MLLIGLGHGALDLLRGVELVLAKRYLVVLAGQKDEDVDVVVAALRPVDQPAGAGALAQRVVDIFRIVGEHAEGAVAAHDGRRRRQRLSISTPVISCWPADARSSERLRRDLVDVVDGAEADGARVEHIVDELLAVLAGLALVGRDLVDAEILVDEGIAGDLAIAVDETGDHLDQRRLAGAGRAVADEGEEEAAEFDERVQFALEVIGHQHLGELDRLVFGDVVADDLFRRLERHHQRF